jgi:hypothetical protein
MGGPAHIEKTIRMYGFWNLKGVEMKAYPPCLSYPLPELDDGSKNDEETQEDEETQDDD